MINIGFHSRDGLAIGTKREDSVGEVSHDMRVRYEISMQLRGEVATERPSIFNVRKIALEPGARTASTIKRDAHGLAECRMHPGNRMRVQS